MLFSVRRQLLHQIADAILRLPANQVVRAGIDGVDGAGKTIFGNELAGILAAGGRNVIRASVDSFHNPRAVRYQRGRSSPEGYFLDSYNYALLTSELLDSLSPGGNGAYRIAAFDYRTDAPVSVPRQQAAAGDILVFDGLFLHRPELRNYWDYSIFLDISPAVACRRCATRDGSPPDPAAPENRRYLQGQELYIRTCNPRAHATLVINNEAIEAPWIMSRSH